MRNMDEPPGTTTPPPRQITAACCFSSCSSSNFDRDKTLHTPPLRRGEDDSGAESPWGLDIAVEHRGGSCPAPAAAAAPLWNAALHHAQPRRSRRRRSKMGRGRAFLPPPACTRALLNALILLLCLLSCCEASPKPLPGTTDQYLEISAQQHRRSPRVARRGESLADPAARMGLAPRDDGDPTTLTKTTTIRATQSSLSSGSQSQRATAATVTTTPDVDAPSPTASSSIPQPFDSNLGNNFTDTCLDFFNNFLANTSFQQCVPFSLLLQNSQGFFQAEKSLVRVTQVLDASCGADFDSCSSIMSDLAIKIQDTNTCGPDYTDRNPIVVGAYNGLLSYQTMYQAACLRDSTGGYCFADAVTNSTSIAGVYPYYLPLGMSLPGGTRPPCTSCLKSTMQAFANAAANASQPVSQTYAQAADQVNVACGPNFAQANVQVRDGSGALALRPAATTGSVVFVAALAALLFDNLF